MRYYFLVRASWRGEQKPKKPQQRNAVDGPLKAGRVNKQGGKEEDANP